MCLNKNKLYIFRYFKYLYRYDNKMVVTHYVIHNDVINYQQTPTINYYRSTICQYIDLLYVSINLIWSRGC